MLDAQTNQTSQVSQPGAKLQNDMIAKFNLAGFDVTFASAMDSSKAQRPEFSKSGDYIITRRSDKKEVGQVSGPGNLVGQAPADDQLKKVGEDLQQKYDEIVKKPTPSSLRQAQQRMNEVKEISSPDSNIRGKSSGHGIELPSGAYLINPGDGRFSFTHPSDASMGMIASSGFEAIKSAKDGFTRDYVTKDKNGKLLDRVRINFDKDGFIGKIDNLVDSGKPSTQSIPVFYQKKEIGQK